MRQSVSLVLAVCWVFVNCVPWRLVDYKLCKRVLIPGVVNDASGATYTNDSLLILANKPARIIELGNDGFAIDSVTIMGFEDPEGITFIPPDRIAIAEEAFGGTICFANYSSSTQIIVNEERYPLRVNNNPNTGLEAIAYDEVRNVFYMGVENDPRKVVEVSGDGTSVRDLFIVGNYFKDLSGMYFDKNTQNLYILSQESQMVAKVSRLGSLLELRPLEAARPEGIAFSNDGQVMFIVSEPNLLYIYAADGDCEILDKD